MNNVKQPDSTDAPIFEECSLWKAMDAYGDPAGILVTERGDRDKMIAFLFIDQERKNEALIDAASMIADEPQTLDGMIPSTGDFCRIDLRDRGRSESTRAVPGWIYGMTVTPETPEYNGEWFALNPFCPIRLAQMLAKKPA